MKSFVVIGLGRFGARVAEKLYEMGNEVIVIDLDPEKIKMIADHVTQAAVGDARDKEVLHALGVHNCDFGIVAIGKDLSSSIVATMNLKELDVPYILAKAQTPTHQRILEKLGADKVVIPERESADRIAHKLVRPNILDYIEISSEYSMLEEQVPNSWLNKSIKDLSIRARLGINIIAVKNGKNITIAPGADYVIREGDVAVIIGKEDSLQKLKKN